LWCKATCDDYVSLCWFFAGVAYWSVSNCEFVYGSWTDGSEAPQKPLNTSRLVAVNPCKSHRNDHPWPWATWLQFPFVFSSIVIFTDDLLKRFHFAGLFQQGAVRCQPNRVWTRSVCLGAGFAPCISQLARVSQMEPVFACELTDSFSQTRTDSYLFVFVLASTSQVERFLCNLK